MKQNESPEDIQIQFSLHNVRCAVEDIIRLITIPRQSRGLSVCEPLKAAKRGR